MSERNGPDIAAVYQLLTEVARIVAGHDRRFDQIDRRLDEHDRRFDEHDRKINELVIVVNDHSRVLGGITAVLTDHGRKLDDLDAGQKELRAALTHYHTTVLGHGVLISDLDERVRRIERHLRLEPAG
ncbi:MAG TPA: hypothetical protein VGR91_06895 [Stellaceae bacterium]|nr:hypothetical protein [Stellaceae bacterium]